MQTSCIAYYGDLKEWLRLCLDRLRVSDGAEGGAEDNAVNLSGMLVIEHLG